jgi:hypothetical protein
LTAWRKPHSTIHPSPPCNHPPPIVYIKSWIPGRYSSRKRALLQGGPELRCGTLTCAVSEVENCITGQVRIGRDTKINGAWGGTGEDSHSSTQSSLGCFLSTGFPSSAPVTRSTHSSKWCLEGAHVLDSLHSVSGQHLIRRSSSDQAAWQSPSQP